MGLVLDFHLLVSFTAFVWDDDYLKVDNAFDGKSAYPLGSIYEEAIALLDSQWGMWYGVTPCYKT